MPDQCVSASDGYYILTGLPLGPCGPSYMTAADLWLFGPGADIHNPGAASDHFVLTSPQRIDGLLLLGGVLAGVDDLLPIRLTHVGSNGDYWNSRVSIQFSSGCLALVHVPQICQPFHLGPITFPVFNTSTESFASLADSNTNDYVNIVVNGQRSPLPATDVTFVVAAVPEPGSVALLLAAVGVLWLTRRRAESCKG